MVKFSGRTEWDLAETLWGQQLGRLRSSGAKLLDLTASNPTQCGFHYDSSSILGPLLDPEALHYDPNPRGRLAARQSVCGYYAEHGVELDPHHLFLTTGTSEAYSFLFRLLCDPGDEVLFAQPSYPLFDFLAQLDDVRLIPYELLYDHGWHLDPEAVRRHVTPRTKAIAVVHPNNPTGHFTRTQDRAELEKICKENDLALLVDEVFLDYSLAQPGSSFATGDHAVLTFVLSGISKVAALPQMKAAWIAGFAPPADLADALARLEVIADTFLSMNAPVQCALPAWLRKRGDLQRQIRERVSRNLAVLDAMLSQQTMVTRLAVEAGWYVVLRVPALQPDEETVLELLSERGVAVHAGYFFGFPAKGWLVVSLLSPEEEFGEGVDRILSYFARDSRRDQST